ncbi:MAG: hypothetical protein C0604_07365 [Clostridiales bacterium]|nr:MAG: hypothetical protein C0604_07365 [Clostridiales bacterium]
MTVIYADSVFWLGVSAYNIVAPDGHEVNLMNMSADSPENENRRLEQILSDHDYNIYDLVWIEDGATFQGTHIRGIDSRKVYEQFLEFSEEEDIFSENIDYVLNVALVQWFGGESEKAISIIESIEPAELDGDAYDEYQIIQAGIGLTYHDLDKVKNSLEKIKGEDYSKLAQKIKEFISSFYDGGLEYEDVEIGQKTIDDNRYIGYYSEMISLTDTWNSEYREKRNEENQSNSTRILYGYVTRGGKALEGVFLYEDISSGMSSREGFDREVFVTDSEGRYQIKGLNPETRHIGMAIPWHLIHDQQWINNNKVEKETETVDFELKDGVRFTSLSIEDGQLLYEISDAARNENRSYFMKIRSTDPAYDINGSSIDWEINSSEMTGKIPLDEIAKRSSFSFSYGSSEEELDIKRFLEPLYLTDEYYFEVRPVDEDRSNFSWNGLFSDALAFSLHVEGRDEMSKGDALLSEGKVEEAMEWYDTDGSAHSLKVLAALYTRGYIPDEENSAAWELGGVDHFKAAEYMERLIEKDGSTNDRLNQLARQYKESFQYEKEGEVLSELRDAAETGDSEDAYLEMVIANNMIMRGRYIDGTDRYFEVGDPEIDGDRYFAYFLLGMRTELLPDEYSNELLEVEEIKDYETFNQIMAEGKYIDAWEWMYKMPDSDIKTFYTLLMLDRMNLDGISFKDMKTELGLEEKDRFIDFYVEETMKMENERLSKVLRLLKEDYNWFWRDMPDEIEPMSDERDPVKDKKLND